MGTLATATTTGRQIAAEVAEKNVTFMAAGIAYNAFISLVPLLFLLLLLISVVGGGLESRLVLLAETSLPGPIADVVARVFEGGATGPSASLVGGVVLVWGTLKIFRGLDTAFSEIYETADENTFLDKLVDAVVVLVAILVAILSTVAVTVVFATYAGVFPFVGVLTPLALVVGLAVAFVPMYYRFPDADVRWTDVLPGVAFAAVGWAAFQSLFQVYLAVTGGGSQSFFGGVVVVITWLYFSGLVLLLGAVINAVVGGYSSGTAGGVGRGATGHETEREMTLDRDGFLDYLQELRTNLAGRSDEKAPANGPGEVRWPPAPTDDVTVIEQSRSDGDDHQWAISIRWRTTEEGVAGASDATAHDGEASSR